MMTMANMSDVAVDRLAMPSPDSPPGMTASKSSKSSSLHSFASDDNTVLADANHFEDIGLEDDISYRDPVVKSAPNPYSALYASDLRTPSHNGAPSARMQSSRDLSRPRLPRDAVTVPKTRPSFPSLKAHVRDATNVRSTSTNQLLPEPSLSPMSARNFGSRSIGQNAPGRRRRTPSPNLYLASKDPNSLMKPRRSSWQSNRERKSAIELERECDEDEGDDIPDGLFLDNIPISPRPPQERAKSQPSSKAPSPEPPKERVRSVGNGTPPVAVAQGSLRSPIWRSDSAGGIARPDHFNGVPSPLKTRAKSWTAALAELSVEAKQLTEKLEEHADEVDHKAQRSSTGSLPTSLASPDPYDLKPRHKSALAELPPLRRTNIMIDPLPISKEKEAVLSRTRPSWLPPKDPAEERRHLREYQKMMAQSVEAERRKEATRKVKSEQRDTAADGLMHMWEHEILPRWNDAIRERRTRELWWHGIAPRSRGLVWSKAIGNELGLTETSYKAALGRVRECEGCMKAGNGSVEDAKHAEWFKLIRNDVESKTWGDLRIFQAGGPLHQSLVDLLSAYSMYRSDIGYIAGCNTVAALLLLNLPSPAAAFVGLANLLNRPLPLSFYAADPGAKASAYNLLLQTLSHRSPDLFQHLINLPDHDPDTYLGDMFISLFTSHLALDEAARLWDVYVFEGDAVLVRAGVALLVTKEMALLGTTSVTEVKAVLENDGDTKEESRPSVVGVLGQEDRWMRAVREAGKA